MLKKQTKVLAAVAIMTLCLTTEIAVDKQVVCAQEKPQMAMEQVKSAVLAESYNDQGIIYAKQHFYEMARQDFLQAIALAESQNRINIYNNNLAMVTKDLGNYEEALKIINKVLTNDENMPSALNTKGDILVSMKQYDAAVSIITKAITLRPEDGTSYYIRGRAREGLKQLSLAREDYKKAASLPSDYQKEAKIRLKDLQ